MKMPEKSMLPSRILFYFILVSMFLVVLSSLSLLQSTSHSLLPKAVFRLMLINNTSFYFKPYLNSETSLASPYSQVHDEIPLGSRALDYRISNSSQKMVRCCKKRNMPCDPRQALLRIYMYDLPPEFHFGLLGWEGMENQTWPEVDKQNRIPQYPGGLNLQHSMEYWLTLDLLASTTPNIKRPCNAIRVTNSSEADLIFVPFFSSLSYNRHSRLHGKEKVSVNQMLQAKLVKFLLGRKEWKRLGGKDHLIVAHHPNSMLYARKKLGSAMFLLADFGRYPVELANINKDVIAPYMHLVSSIPRDKSPSFQERPTLLYFRGAIYRKDGGFIRQELYYLLKDEKDVQFAFGNIRGNGIHRASQGMTLSKFCLNIAGDTPSSNRLFDAIVRHCVPVIISDQIELPFEAALDYSEFCIFVKAADAVKKGYLLSQLRSVKEENWTKMWERLKAVAHHFEYHYPSQPGDAVDMIWEAVSYKTSFIQLNTHRKNRYRRSQLHVNSK